MSGKRKEIELLLSEVEDLSLFQKDKDALRIQNLVVQVHSTLEVLINFRIITYYFGKELSSADKANHFWINILSEMNFSKKISICQTAGIFTKKIINILNKINEIRNDIAHYPNRIHKRKKAHLCYDGKNIYEDLEAMQKLCLDSKKILIMLRNQEGL